MKYFFPLLMGLVILSGVALTFTPYIAEHFFPGDETGFHLAKPDEVKTALADWFGATPQMFSSAEGIRKETVQMRQSWFAFSVARQPVEHFIRQYRLQQVDLTPQRLQQIFLQGSPRVAWWKPAELQRETCFTGTDAGQELGLIYNAERQQGVLVVRTRLQP